MDPGWRVGLEELEAGPRGLPLAWEDAVSWETGVEDASRFGQGHWPTWGCGDRKQSRIQKTSAGLCCLRATKQKWRPQRVYARLESEGDKNLGVLRGVMVSVAGVTMGRVYPEKEAGPLGPAGVRMSGR